LTIIFINKDLLNTKVRTLHLSTPKENNMAEVLKRRSPRQMEVYCYDDVTDADEVNETMHDIIRRFRTKKNIWVISGTHGTDAGTVDPTCKEKDFRKEDIDSANVTSKNIHIMDYHMLAPNRWAALKSKSGENNIVILAFCYSSLWFDNATLLGNNGKL